MTAQQTAKYLAGTRNHRYRQVAAYGPVTRRQSVMRRALAESRIGRDIRTTNHALAAQRRTKQLGRARYPDGRECFARRIREREQLVRAATFRVVEERADLGFRQLGTGIHDRPQQPIQIELARQPCSGGIEHAHFVRARLHAEHCSIRSDSCACLRPRHRTQDQRRQQSAAGENVRSERSSRCNFETGLGRVADRPDAPCYIQRKLRCDAVTACETACSKRASSCAAVMR